jgi:anti-sigma factor ChrR (cupin superfamily)
MSRVDDQLLAEYALGTLPAGEVARVEAELARDPSLRAELDSIREALAIVGDALPAVKPAKGGRERLMQAVAPRPRLARFAAGLAKLLDLSLEKAKALLQSVDDPKVWEPSGMAGVHFFHLTPGPAYAGADAGIVRIEAGAFFPYHGHTGAESVLYLQGATLDPATGHVFLPGEEDFLPEGATPHKLVALPGADVLYAARLHGELTFPEEP